MRRNCRGTAVFALVGCVLALAAPGVSGIEMTEAEQFEEKAITRCAERAVRHSRTDRARLLKELEIAFPKKVVVNATTEKEYATWFDLLAGKNDQWWRADAPTPQLAEMFDKVRQRLDLGPVPSITREEFAKYAKHILREQNPPPQGAGASLDAEADKVFRVLDRNGDGELDADELTPALKAEKALTDTDKNGRISKAEYREYFKRQVAARAEVIAEKLTEAARTQDGKHTEKAPKLPEWFTTLDLDKDGQISLYEWRKAGRPIAQFQEMDLNGDGLLTPDEYFRWLKMKENAEAQKKREEKNP
jgi:Ca2+-binding EF-hand superfamily protein